MTYLGIDILYIPTKYSGLRILLVTMSNLGRNLENFTYTSLDSSDLPQGIVVFVATQVL